MAASRKNLTSLQVSNKAIPGRHGEESGAPPGEVDEVLGGCEVVNVLVSEGIVEGNQVKDDTPAVLAHPAVLAPTVLVCVHILQDLLMV